MARPATGMIIERRNAAGGINRTLRFYAAGKRRTVPLGSVSGEEAEKQLAYVMADVQRGTWTPPRRPVEPTRPDAEVPTFHEYAEQWWLRHEAQITAKTRTDYRWRLEKHLLPFFGETPLDEISLDMVERYVAAKLADAARVREAAERGKPLLEEYADGRKRPRQPLGPRSINMTVRLLAAILEGAVERELIPRNPARGKRRRVREHKPARSYLDTAGQICALLDGAGEQDQEATRERQHIDRRALLATMIFAGLRISELCSLRWRDVDLAAGWLTVAESKTDAGARRVRIRGGLRDELVAVRAKRKVRQDTYVFPTRTGRRQYECNVREGTLGAAVKRANKNLEAADLAPLPEKLTPHSLRRTFASILYALGEPPPVVMAEMGHTDPALALRVYAQAMRRGEDERAQLASLVEGGVWAHKGTNAVSAASVAA